MRLRPMTSAYHVVAVTSYTSMRISSRTCAGTRSTPFTDEDGTTSAYRVWGSWLVIRRSNCP